MVNSTNILYHRIPYRQKYWRELNLVVGPQIANCENIGGFKFGGSVRDRHTYICKYEILADFNLVVAKTDHQTAKFSGYTVYTV